MARPRKESKNLHMKVNKELYERFERYADDLGQTKTTALERILAKALKEYDAAKEAQKQ